MHVVWRVARKHTFVAMKNTLSLLLGFRRGGSSEDEEGYLKQKSSE